MSFAIDGGPATTIKRDSINHYNGSPMHTLYLLISQGPDETFVEGVYHDIKMAQNHYIDLLKHPTTNKLLMEKFNEEFGYDIKMPTSRKILHRILFASPEELDKYALDVRDFFHDSDVCFSVIVDTVAGEIFDFTGWNSWNLTNLYEALVAIKENRSTKLRR